MRLLLLLLIVTACAGLPRRDASPMLEREPVRQEQPEPPKKQERPVTIITVNPPAKPQAICVPLAIDQKKRILEALECAIEAQEKKK